MKIENLIFIGMVVFFSLIVILLIYGFTFLYNINTSYQEETKKACQNIGYEEYRNNEGMEYCIDKQGNMHYVDLQCDESKMLFGIIEKCNARLITVGNVRVIQEVDEQ